MLKHISRPTTLGLLEQLVPSLVVRARAFSQPAHNHAPTQQHSQDGSRINSRIRQQIMGQTQSRRIMPGKDKYDALVAHIEEDVKGGDIEAALLHWRSLEDYRQTRPDGEISRLRDATTKNLQNLFVSQIWNSFSRKRVTDSVMLASKEFAMQAAKYHSAEPLSVLMLLFIQQDDPQAVFQLYKECLQTLGTTSLVPPEAEDESLALSEDEEYERRRLDPGRVAVLLAVITAHALQGSFKPAYDTYVSSGIRLRNHRRQSFLRRLQHNPPLLQKVHTYLDRFNNAWTVSRPISFTKHVMNMSHPRSAQLLEKYYSGLRDGMFGAEPYLAADPSQLSETKLAALTQPGWTSLQTAFIKCERIDLAARLWDDMAAAGIKPSITVWTGLLDTYADLRNSKQAMTTWNMMLSQGVQPDDLSYRAIISALFDDQLTDEALSRFKDYQKLIGGRSGSAALSVYNTVLRGLLRINHIQDANTLLDDMVKHGPQPDVISFNTFIAFHGRQQDFKSLATIISQMSAAKITADVFTSSTILSALLKAGRQDATSMILNIMRKQGVKPTVATYTSIIDHQMKQQTEANLNAALTLLEKMEKEDGIKPNEVTYTAILAGLYRSRWISRGRADEIRKQLVSRMRQERVVFRLTTYNILIRAALDSDDESGHLDALGLLEEMENLEIPRGGNTWYILFAGLMRRGLWDVADEMIVKMHHSGYQPSARIEALVSDIRRRRTL